MQLKHAFSQEILACLAGIVIGGLATWFVVGNDSGHFHATTHPIADPYDSQYHVHADFLIVIDDELVNLSDERFMTTSQQEFHPDAHLHDGNGEVKHIHAEGITFAEFLHEHGFALTEDCIAAPDGEERCVDEEHVLQLYVNGEVTTSLLSYIPVDDDRMLLYYGLPENPSIAEYLEAIPDDSCYYSGTCPERGVAPPESCGLTCEL